MSKKIGFLIFFAALLGLMGVVQAESLPVSNHSFEKSTDGNQITTDPTGFGYGPADVCDWVMRDSKGYGWTFVTVEGTSGFAGFETADGTVGAVSVPLHNPAAGAIYEFYQILDPNDDSDVRMAANRAYTLTFNALDFNPSEYPALDVNAVIFYCNVADNNKTDANDVVLASKRTRLEAPGFGQPGYAGWEEIELTYVALTGAPAINKRIAVKFNIPVPYSEGTFAGIDNVRLTWDYLYQAWNPKPADEADFVSKTSILKWNPGLWTKSKGGHDVYFGTSWDDVNDATTADLTGIFKVSQDGNSYDPPGTALTLGQTYYWRIDEACNPGSGPPIPPIPPPVNGKWKGNVWSFTVEGRARSPYPKDHTLDAAKNVILQWVAGTDVNAHDVYFGTDENVVEAATTATSGIYKTRLRKNTPEYDTTGLNLQVGEKYFWRIDEVNTLTVKGYVWDFKVVDYMLVDDFEFYATTTSLNTKWKAVNSNTAYVTLNKDANWANEDGNSMMFEYNNNNSPYRAEAKRTYSTGQDWSYAGNGVTLMELSFYGDVDNFYDQFMYVTLSDGTNTKQLNLPDFNDVYDPNQHIWNIPLKDFTGVDRSKISSIIVGVGNGSKSGGPGDEMGTIYFDDIKLWPPRCLSAMVPEANFHNVADFTTAHHDGNDCITDYEDLSIMAERDWLMTGVNVPPTAPPTGPIGWYKFDEGSGTTTKNDGSAGTTYNGSFVGTPTWSTDANVASSLDFDGAKTGATDGVLVNDSMDLTGSSNVTFTAWVRRDVAIPQYSGVIVISRDSAKDGGTGLHTDGTGTSALGYTWNNWQYSWGWDSGLVMPLNEWAFVALAVEPTQAIMYLGEPNGASYKLTSSTNATGHEGLSDPNLPWDEDMGGWDGTSRFYLGRDDPNKSPSYTFYGKVDDVRIYDYTLSRANIMYLAGVTGTVYVPLDNFRADINNDDKVNLKDYATLADHWLERILWPAP